MERKDMGKAAECIGLQSLTLLQVRGNEKGELLSF